MLKRIKAVIPALSLANLLFISQWHDLLAGYYTPSPDFLKTAPIYESLEAPASAFFALVFCVILLGVAIHVFELLLGHLRPRWRWPALLLLWWLPLFFSFLCFRRILGNLDFSRSGFFAGKPLGFAFFFAILFFASHLLGVIKWPEKCCRNLRFLTTLLMMLFMLNIFNGARRFVEQARSAEPTSLVSSEKLRSPLRIVVLLFDKWDFGLSFTHRPASLRLPTIDRLRESSAFFESAYPPATYTSPSITSLLTGRKISEHIRWTSSKTYEFREDGQPARVWSDDHVFSALASIGAASAVVGYYLPYCSLYGRFLSQCFRYPHYANNKHRYRSGFFANVGNFLSEFFNVLIRRNQLFHLQVKELIDRGVETATDRDLSFVFVHFPFPHGPAVYDAEYDEFVPIGSPTANEDEDSLILVDRSLARVEAALKKSGVGRDTVLIVTADHPTLGRVYRDGSKDLRVPFLISLPGQRARTVSTKINTRRLRKLIESSLAQGALTDALLEDWISSAHEAPP